MSVDAFMNIIMASMIIEAIIETLKLAFKTYEKYTTVWSVANLFVSIMICYNYNLDLLGLLGYKDHIPFLGVILTGILISRGSNYIHDLVNKLSPTVEVPTKKIISSNPINPEQTITKI